MIANGPLSPYPALLTKILFWDSWNITFENERSTAIIGKTSTQVIYRWAHLRDDATSQKYGMPVTFLPVFRIEVWDSQGANRPRLDLVRVLFRVLDDISSE